MSPPIEPTQEWTPLQGQYLAFIATYEQLYDCAPAEADLQQHFRVTPPSVHQMILTLERRGLISRVPGVARSIRLLASTSILPPLESPSQMRSKATARGTAVPNPRRPRRGPKRRPPAPVDPATEYIDSPVMAFRLRDGDEISARIDGRYGVYLTKARLTPRLDGTCTCPSDVQPCKHLRAVRETWELNPGSFFDVRVFLRSLGDRRKAELIDAIGRIILRFPDALGLLGVPGFDEEDSGSQG
jgi:hypothetical protein